MTLHPEIQRRAQQEIDSVTGGERLPDFSDLKLMPFTEAVFQETMRWGCPVTLSTSILTRIISLELTQHEMEGLPHFIDVEDKYKEFHIEAGTTVRNKLAS